MNLTGACSDMLGRTYLGGFKTANTNRKDNNMRVHLVELTDPGGALVLVNPALIVAVQQDGGKSRLALVSGRQYLEVAETQREIVALFAAVPS